MKISILGSGAMGILFGGLLAKEGSEVNFIDINPTAVQKIKQHGVQLQLDDRRIYVANVEAFIPNEVSDIPDIIIVFTKVMHTTEALFSIQHIIGEKTRVITLQNGLGNAQKLEKFISRENIIVGMTTWPADLIEQGWVSSHGKGEIKLASLDKNIDDVLNEIVEVFNRAALNCVLDNNIWSSIWEKVAFNCALNSICAVSKSTVDQLDLVPKGRFLALKIVDEVLSVAEANNISVNKLNTHNKVISAIENHKGHMPSMLQDIQNQRKTEIESLNSAVVYEAKKLNIEIPHTETLEILIQLIESHN